MIEVYLIRHTTPDIDQGLCYGASDIDVTSDFKKEAAHIKATINNFDPEHIYTSPLIRCKKLADDLYPQKQISQDARLMEMNFGDWELQQWKEINNETIEHWSNDFVNLPTPNGENFKDLNTRSLEFWKDKIQVLPSSSKVAIVTHSGVMRCLLSKFLHIPLDKIFRLKLNYGAVIKITLYPDFEEVEII
ncbi:alpha-ribazole phosphatase [Labilibacter sediminis]|nr:alpha-ribazole phosphatase [Labilibacter sediminis]